MSAVCKTLPQTAPDLTTTFLELVPALEGPPAALLLIKMGFSVTPGGECLPCPASPLQHDPRGGPQGLQVLPGCDFWPRKDLTDVVVLGSAFAPGRRPASAMEASVTVGRARKRVAVFGRREVRWDLAGRPSFSPPEPFTEMPLCWENAYGGVDWRVPLPGADDPAMAMLAQHDHPGIYPRNPFGKGYLVLPDPVSGMELPTLEDPDDLLTPGRLLVGRPGDWWRQPLPWTMGWVHPMAFPRRCFFADGADAWHPGPEDQSLAEVARGQVPAGYRALMRGRPLELGPHPLFFQEASAGLALAGLHGGEPVSLRGLHPELAEVRFCLPSLPRIRMGLAGELAEARPRLHSLVLRPAELRLELLVAADLRLSRTYLPGVHRVIPLEAEVEGFRIRYQAPPVVHG